jgi:hypothetical protein
MTWTPDDNMTPKQIEKELERQVLEFQKICEKGLALDANITFADYVNNVWLEQVKNEIKPTTFRRYNQILARTLPALGHYKISQIQPYHLYSFYDDLREEKRDDAKYIPNDKARELCKSETRPEISEHVGISLATVDSVRAKKSVSRETAEKFANYFNKPVSKLFDVIEENLSPRTILHHHRVISTIMQSAVYDEVILTNPCQRTKAPRVERQEAGYLDDKQAEQLMNMVLI